MSLSQRASSTLPGLMGSSVIRTTVALCMELAAIGGTMGTSHLGLKKYPSFSAPSPRNLTTIESTPGLW